MRDSTRGWLGQCGHGSAVCQKAENIFVKQRGAESRWMFAACSREQADLFAGFFHGWQIAPHRSFVFGHLSRQGLRKTGPDSSIQAKVVFAWQIQLRVLFSAGFWPHERGTSRAPPPLRPALKGDRGPFPQRGTGRGAFRSAEGGRSLAGLALRGCRQRGRSGG